MMNNKEKSFNGRLFLTVLFCFFAIIQSSLRDINKLPQGNDTPAYYSIYQIVSNSSWKTVIYGTDFNISDYTERDFGFPVFMKATQLIYDDFTFFMFLTAFIFIVPLSMLIFKYVKSYFGLILAFLFYFSIFTNIVNSFMRQAIALGLFLYSIRYVVKQQWKKYYSIVIIAFTIHTSSIVVFPFYFMPKLSRSRKWLSFAFVLFPVLIYFQSTLFGYFITGTLYDTYLDTEAVSPINYLLLILLISVLSFISYEIIKKVKEYEILISGVIGLLLLLPVVMMGNTMLRISYYYALFLIPLLPVILDNINIRKKPRSIIYALLSFFFLYIILR